MNCAMVLGDSWDLASLLTTEGDKIANSIDNLSQRCHQSQSQDNLEILTAVHKSLELQVNISSLQAGN